MRSSVTSLNKRAVSFYEEDQEVGGGGAELLKSASHYGESMDLDMSKSECSSPGI